MRTQATTVLTDNFQLAQAVAANYLRHHPLLKNEDWAEEANLLVVTLSAAGNVDRRALPGLVITRMRTLLNNAKRRRDRFEQIAADEYGNPLNGLLDLRSASSLNPNACRKYSSSQPIHTDPRPQPVGFMEALRYVRASAPIQCGAGPETEYYRCRSAENRDRVTVESRREGQRRQYRIKVAQAA